MLKRFAAVIGCVGLTCSGLVPAMTSPAKAYDTPITPACIQVAVAAAQAAQDRGESYTMAYVAAATACMNPEGPEPNPNPPPGFPGDTFCQTHSFYNPDW